MVKNVTQINEMVKEFKQKIKENYTYKDAYQFLDDCYLDAYENDNADYMIAIGDVANNYARECMENNDFKKAYSYQTIAFNCLDSAFHVY